MGCCLGSEEPIEILPDPENGKEQVFILKPKWFSTCWNVYNADSKLWLYVRNESGWCDAKSTFSLENFVKSDGDKEGQDLATIEMEPTEYNIKKSAEFEPESDDDGWSISEWFTGEDDGEFEVKMKYEISRRGKLKIEGKTYELGFSMKGETKVEYEVVDGDTSEEPASLSTKVKKVNYKFIKNDDKLALEYDNGDWESDKERKWTAPGDFSLKKESGEISCTTMKGSSLPAAASVLIAWFIAAYCDPSTYTKEQRRKALEYGREVVKARNQE